MLHRRTLIATVAACALSASGAGATAAMPDGNEGPSLPTEVALFQQRAASPSSSVAGIGAHEVSVFHARAHRVVAEHSPGDEALDGDHEAAGYVGLEAETTTPQWFDALMGRSDALNRMFGLGAHADLAD